MKDFKDILSVLSIAFIVLMFFSYSISFLNTFENAYFYSITNLYYNLKKILVVGIGLTIPFCSRNKFISFLVVGLGSFAFISAHAFFPERSAILQSLFFDYFGCLLVFHCVVSIARPFSEVLKYFLWGSRILCILIPYALLNFLNVELAFFLKSNYMSFANAIMVPLSIEIYNFILRRNIFDAILAIVAFFFLFLGSRGSMLSMLLLIVVLVYQNRKVNVKNFLFLCIVVLICLYLFEQFVGSGMLDFSDNRTFEFLTRGTKLKDEDRFQIWSQVINGISNVFFGDGIFADRQILMAGRTLGVAYAHNVFVESFSDFGVIGLFFMIWLYYKSIRAMFCPSENQHLIIVFFFISAFQLLFSRSVLLEYNFFILAGLVYLSSNRNQQYVNYVKSNRNE